MHVVEHDFVWDHRMAHITNHCEGWRFGQCCRILMILNNFRCLKVILKFGLFDGNSNILCGVNMMMFHGNYFLKITSWIIFQDPVKQELLQCSNSTYRHLEEKWWLVHWLSCSSIPLMVSDTLAPTEICQYCSVRVCNCFVVFAKFS